MKRTEKKLKEQERQMKQREKNTKSENNKRRNQGMANQKKVNNNNLYENNNYYEYESSFDGEEKLSEDLEVYYSKYCNSCGPDTHSVKNRYKANFACRNYDFLNVNRHGEIYARVDPSFYK